MEGWLSRVLADVGRRAQRPKILQARTTSSCRVSSWLTKARNLTSVFMQLRIDARSSCSSSLPSAKVLNRGFSASISLRQYTEYREPTSGLEPLTCSSYE